jgi:hypothetical protein
MNSAPTKTELSKYSPSEVMGIARSMQGEISDRILKRQQLQERLARFKFRDEQGYYWTVEPRTLTWYVYFQGRWNPGNAPQSALEGPAYQAITPLPLRNDSAKGGESAAPNRDPIGGFAAGIREIKLAYDQGQITSTAAESLASLFFLVDKNMRLWTMGLQSAAWYYFDAGYPLGAWNRASQPLDASQLSDQSYNPDAHGDAGSTQGMEQAKAKLVELAKTGVLIPEPVSAPFNPPLDSPTPAYPPGTVPMPMPMPAPMSRGAGFCPNCGRPVAPGIGFCGVCGYPIGGRANV